MRGQAIVRQAFVVSVFLLASGWCGWAADWDLFGLIDAIKGGNDTVARALLNDSRTDVNVRQGDGAIALHWAAYHNDLELVSMLVRRGADVNAANDLGVTPLVLACTKRSA